MTLAANDTGVILHTVDNLCGQGGLMGSCRATVGRRQGEVSDPHGADRRPDPYGGSSRPICHGESRKQDQRVYSGLVQYQVLDNRLRAAKAPMIMISPASRAAIQAVPNEAWTPAPISSR